MVAYFNHKYHFYSHLVTYQERIVNEETTSKLTASLNHKKIDLNTMFR